MKNKQLRLSTVTGNLVGILSEMFPERFSTPVYRFSDTRKPKGKRAAGIKIPGLYLTTSEKNYVIDEMNSRGFIFHYIRENIMTMGNYNGTRFCFSKD